MSPFCGMNSLQYLSVLQQLFVNAYVIKLLHLNLDWTRDDNKSLSIAKNDCFLIPVNTRRRK